MSDVDRPVDAICKFDCESCKRVGSVCRKEEEEEKEAIAQGARQAARSNIKNSIPREREKERAKEREREKENRRYGETRDGGAFPAGGTFVDRRYNQ